MSYFLLGIAAGSFIAAIVNHNYNTVKWIKTRYLVWTGIIILIAGFILSWPDFKRGFLNGYEDALDSQSQMEYVNSSKAKLTV